MRVGPQGGSFSPTTGYQYICPPGTYVTGFNGRSGDVLDRIGPLRCSDGSLTTGAAGGPSGGNPFVAVSATGYSGIRVRAGTLLDSLTLIPVGSGAQSFGGSGGNDKPAMDCPPGFSIAGIFGLTTPADVISIGIICRSTVPLIAVPAVGGTAPLAVPFEKVCLIGTKMTGILGRVSNQIDGLGNILCSNGAQVGGITGSPTNGGPFSLISSNGFTGITARATVVLTQITANRVGGPPQSVGPPTGNPQAPLVCPSGKAIAGIYGSAAANVIIKIGIVCL